ncbi:type II secretion system protein GspL [Sulfitobacter guttiformis]|uniref:General secretion pathway protein L n=1 Tax=Sulfitobacter guttiformis TaxID=74349 RepID=A0A420DTC5_9RHOB|nr:type II secretion system protein GspL [Sulfitobacter guttiformis]KIN71063.1 general secretion pathway protein L [Sulfitobacter guttiformis KCTC 32187]RKE97546.1 general secretion pathway protein L [Sulfitobacter guttiformis]
MKTKKSLFFQKVTAPSTSPDAANPDVSSKSGSVQHLAAYGPLHALALRAVDQGFTVVPAENVGLHSIALPVKSTRQQAAALPFALEDAIACPLEQTHFSLLGDRSDGMTLAATIDVSCLLRYLEKGSPDSAIIPEQALIHPPVADAAGHVVWRAYRHADRVLVRASDGTGFAVHADVLAHIWQAAGKPRVDSYGADLPAGFPCNDLSAQEVPQPDSLFAADLRQGVYRPSQGFARPLKLLAACAAIAALFHLGIAVLDVRAQKAIAQDLRADAARALTPLLPDASPDDPPALLQRQLAALAAPQRGSSFLPLMDRVAEALLLLPDAVQFRQLNWAGDTLRLTVEAADLGALQRAETGLKDSGLLITVGSAAVDSGAARAELTVRP